MYNKKHICVGVQERHECRTTHRRRHKLKFFEGGSCAHAHYFCVSQKSGLFFTK